MLLDENKIEQIAKIQKSELEDRDSVFISACSTKFISLFYKKAIHYNSIIFCVDETPQNEIRGFVFCTTNRQEYYRKFFKENKLQLILYPSIYIPLFKAILRKIKTNLFHKRERYYYNYEVVYMAVKRQYQEQGIGKKLINLAEEKFAKRKINKYYIQVFSDNIKAIEFYKSVGFVIESCFYVNGLKKFVMHKNISLI